MSLFTHLPMKNTIKPKIVTKTRVVAGLIDNKFIKMKSLKISSLLLFALMFIGCVTEADMFDRRYSVSNESGVAVELRFYRISDNKLINEVELQNHSQFNFRKLVLRIPISKDPDYIGPNTASGSDSLVIIYDAKKKGNVWVDMFSPEPIFSEPKNRNVFRHGSYQHTAGDEYVFTLTEEDYAKAADCMGSCD